MYVCFYLFAMLARKALTPQALVAQGDACNLVGCLLTGAQLPLTTGTAWYFIMCDLVMMMQYTYYSAISAQRTRRAQRHAKRRAVHEAARSARKTLQQQESWQPRTSASILAAAPSAAAAAPAGQPGMPNVHSQPRAFLPSAPALHCFWHVGKAPALVCMLRSFRQFVPVVTTLLVTTKA